MTQYRVSASATVRARPAEVYAAIADYKEQHPHIVPPEYFRRLEVLEGGVGAGTRTRVEMRILGMTSLFEQIVTEPEPGHVLVETNQDGKAVTTFTVRETDGGDSAQVTIATELVAPPGLAGFVERLFVSMMLPKIYRKELARLADYVTHVRSNSEAGT